MCLKRVSSFDIFFLKSRVVVKVVEGGAFQKLLKVG